MVVHHHTTGQRDNGESNLPPSPSLYIVVMVYSSPSTEYHTYTALQIFHIISVSIMGLFLVVMLIFHLVVNHFHP